MARWRFRRVLAFGQDLSDSLAAGWGQKMEGTLMLEIDSPTLSALTFTFCLSPFNHPNSQFPSLSNGGLEICSFLLFFFCEYLGSDRK